MSDERINRMLSKIDDSFDTSKGSFFYDNLKAVDIEFDEEEKKINEIINDAFVDTATGEFLDRRVAEEGLKRKEATRATGTVLITGQEGAVVTKGDKVASDEVNYSMTETKTIDASNQVTVNIECDELGSIGNAAIGVINRFPVTIQGLSDVTNNEPLDNGYDEETDDELRERFLKLKRTPAASGNKNDYYKWSLEVNGVGGAKVFPIWNGAGTVKVVVIGNDNLPASTELITEVTNYIEEVRPIGANVTVISALTLNVDISATLTIDSTFDVIDIKSVLEDKLIRYFADLAFSNTDYISYAQVGGLIIETEGVIDYTSLLINSGTTNITIGNEEVPVLNSLTII